MRKMCLTSVDLKVVRNKHGLSQSEAALLVRVSQRSWARYESGDREPPEGLVELLCIKLGEKYVSPSS